MVIAESSYSSGVYLRGLEEKKTRDELVRIHYHSAEIREKHLQKKKYETLPLR